MSKDIIALYKCMVYLAMSVTLFQNFTEANLQKKKYLV